MKYIFELNHPKHYYQFKYVMQSLRKQGHEIKVLARDKDVLLDVLKEEGVDYTIFGKHNKSMSAKIFGTFALVRNYIAIVRQDQPDIIVSKGSLYGTLTAKLMGKKSVIFPDSEVVKVTNNFVVPLCTKVVTPQSFQLDFGEKHCRINGLFEDCYLSPQAFQPNPDIIEKYELKRPYAIIRFVGWFANHDVGNNGFTLEEKIKLVETIAKNMTVYISSEKPLPEPLSQYKLNTPASLIHDVLSYADLYVGDSQTMAAESALLGTPSIRSNSFVGPNDMSNFKILESKYGLLRNIAKPQDAIDLAAEWSAHSQKNEWKNKQKDYYSQVGDINANIVSLLTNI